jgi:hypothetical protein
MGLHVGSGSLVAARQGVGRNNAHFARFTDPRCAVIQTRAILVQRGTGRAVQADVEAITLQCSIRC